MVRVEPSTVKGKREVKSVMGAHFWNNRKIDLTGLPSASYLDAGNGFARVDFDQWA